MAYKVIQIHNYQPASGEIIDQEPCATYDDCADIMTPKQAMLKMLAGGQVADLRRRSAFYDEEEMDDYTEATYPCDYIELYNDYLAKVAPYSKNKENLASTQKSDKVKAEKPEAVVKTELKPDELKKS